MTRTSWLTAVYYLGLLAALVYVHLALIEYADDDAYIHLRIAERLLHDGVPYFNPGEPVMASSSPLRTVVLFALFWTFGVSVYPIAVLNSAATCLTVLVAGRLIKKALDKEDFWIDLMTTVIVVSFCFESSVGLMETPLALLVTIFGIEQYLHRRPSAFLFLAVAVFFRVELAVFLLVAAIHCIYTCTMPMRKWIWMAFLGALPCLAYDLYYFGGVVPQAMTAKSVIYQLSVVEFGMLMYRFTFGPHWCIDLIALLAIYLLTVPWLFLYGFIATRRQAIGGMTGRTALVLFAPGAMILGAYTLKKVFIFPWYVPLFTVPMFLGMFLVAYSRNSALLRRAFLLLLIPPVFNLSANISASIGNKSWYTNFAFGARTRRYIDVADKLYQKYPHATMMSTEAGALGARFPSKFIDASGLITPEALNFHPLKVPDERKAGYLGCIPPGLVRKTRPDIIVSYDAMLGPLANSDVLNDYVREVIPPLLPDDLAISNQRQYWFGRNLNIFIRKAIYHGPLESHSNEQPRMSRSRRIGR